MFRDDTMVYPGHGEMFCLGDIRAYYEAFIS